MLRSFPPFRGHSADLGVRVGGSSVAVQGVAVQGVAVQGVAVQGVAGWLLLSRADEVCPCALDVVRSQPTG
ncbi:hypothetical protein Acsp01_35430 [Actinoplanes sp. NBRC 101535]|nr:hypothetical protein Acsp01_35430 [Actinoplanes sp. NBRC 101535]